MQSLPQRLAPYTNVDAVPVDTATGAGSRELARRFAERPLEFDGPRSPGMDAAERAQWRQEMRDEMLG